MNVRCYKCGNSFSLSRDVVEAAVAAAGDDKYYVAYCPRCRNANKVPMQQLKRSLPVGWTAPAAVAVEVPAAMAVSEPAPEPVAQAETAPAAKAPRKRASKTTEATPTPKATPAANKASRSKAKPS